MIFFLLDSKNVSFGRFCLRFSDVLHGFTCASTIYWQSLIHFLGVKILTLFPSASFHENIPLLKALQVNS